MSRADAVARRTVVVIALAIGALGALASRSLHADGAYYLWFMVQHQCFFTYPDRVFAQVLTQLPPVLAMWLGVDYVPALVILQGIGLTVLTTAVWAAALTVLHRHRLFWTMAVAFAVTYLNSGFMSVGEFNLAYALVALCAAILLCDSPRGAHWVALVASAVILLRSYESLVFLGPLLAGLVVLALRRPLFRSSRIITVVLWCAGGLFALATVLSGWSIVFPRDVTNRQTASDVIGPLLRDPQFVVSSLIALAFVLAAALLRGRARGALLGLLGLACLVILLPGLWARPGLHYDTRVLVGGVLFVLILAGVLLHRRAPEQPTSGWVVAVALLVALSVPFVAQTVGYARWLATFQDVLADNRGPVLLQNTLLIGESSLYAWSWTHPYLSVLLRPADSDVIVQPADTIFQDAPAGLPAGFRTGRLISAPS